MEDGDRGKGHKSDRASFLFGGNRGIWMTAVARPLSVGYRRDKKGGRSTNDGWSITITILEELEGVNRDLDRRGVDL